MPHLFRIGTQGLTRGLWGALAGLTLIVFLLANVPSAIAAQAAATPGLTGKDAFMQALSLLEQGNHKDAAPLFKEASESLPSVNDYALYYEALAYSKCGDYARSAKIIAGIRANHPLTPLKDSLGRLEIDNMIRAGDRHVVKALTDYIRHNPSDEDMKFALASELLRQGSDKKAQPILMDIYESAGPHSDEALKALDGAYIPSHIRVSRIGSLIRKSRYADADTELESLITRMPSLARTREVMDLRARSMFRQRKYTEAAALYRELGDLYTAARAYLRAGDEMAFYKAVDEMISREDDQAAKLLIALSSDLRRDGDMESTNMILDDMAVIFPSYREDALWSKGWTYYHFKDYESARKVFEKMARTYDDNRYRYWAARSAEKFGAGKDDLAAAYSAIQGDDYYAYLAALRLGSPLRQSLPKLPEERPFKDMKRIDTLIEIGLNKEALNELGIAASGCTRPEQLFAIASRMKEIDGYRSAILLMDRVPEKSRPGEIMYPLAYWETVKGAADAYGMDPFLVLSLMREESHYDKDAASSAGALGLMQLMPATAQREARQAKVELAGDKSIQDVDKNILIGSHYLNKLLSEFKSVAASLAAYNAGENRVRQWLRNGDYESFDEFVEDIPYVETRLYVKRIITTYHRYKAAEYPQFSGDTLKVL